MLPIPSKEVIYLDQNAISEIFRIKQSSSYRGDIFWTDLEQAVDRAYLLQQAVFPASDIHNDETIVSHSASELGLAHEMLSGDTSFKNAAEIALDQGLEFAKAFIEGREPPSLNFDVDEILEGERNSWLPPLHITANMDFSFFAKELRKTRDNLGDELKKLAETWIERKPTFRELLTTELAAFTTGKRQALRIAMGNITSGIANKDPMQHLKGAGSPILKEVRALQYLFRNAGVPENELGSKVREFWMWKGNEQQPINRISAYLFAALGWRMSSGRRRMPSRGTFNDFNAIATYGPYVDAMFVDNECALLLTEGRLRREIKLKAKIFSKSSGVDFIAHLNKLSSRSSLATLQYATEIYGLKQ